MKTYTTQYTDETGTWPQEDIEAPYWEWAEDLLKKHILCDRLPPGTVIVGERWKQVDTVTGNVDYLSPDALDTESTNG